MTHPVSLCLSFSLCIHTHTESSDRTALPPLPPPHLTACYFWAAKWTQMNTEEAKEGELTSCSSNLHLSTISSAVPNTHAQKLYLEPPSPPPPPPPSQERLLGKGRVESPHCQVPISCAAEKKLLFAKHWMCSTHTPVRNSQKLFQCASVKKKRKEKKKKEEWLSRVRLFLAEPFLACGSAFFVDLDLYSPLPTFSTFFGGGPQG